MDGTSAYVTGGTESTEVTFPVTVGPDLSYNDSGQGDAFVAKVNPTGTGLDYAGYIGGSGSDSGYGIAIDSTGSAYLAGTTTSSEASFPVAVGPDLTYGGNPYPDGFVAKVNATGTGLDHAGYLGGGSVDKSFGVAVDAAANAYVVGETASWREFPITSELRGGLSTRFKGVFDAFLVKVGADGAGLVYSGFLGGRDFDGARAVALDGTSSAYVAGSTRSGGRSFATKGSFDESHNGGEDAFVAKVSG